MTEYNTTNSMLVTAQYAGVVSVAPADSSELFYFSMERKEIVRLSYIAISLLGIPGNILTLCVILSSRHMRRKPFNILLVQQAVIDGCSCCLGFIGEMIQPSYSPDLDIFDSLSCHIFFSMYVFWCLITASSYNLTAISLERYLAISRPLEYDEETVLHRMPWVMASVWFGSFIVLIPDAIFANFVERECVLYSTLSHMGLVLLDVYYILSLMMVPLLAMVFAYAQIVRSLQQGASSFNCNINSTGNRVSLRKAQINIIQTSSSLSAFFLVCWISFWVIAIGNMFFGIPLQPGYHITTILLLCNSCINPYVYCIRYDEFQNRVIMIFRRIIGSRSSRSHTESSVAISTVPTTREAHKNNSKKTQFTI